MIMDAPNQRLLKIGKTSVNLIGLGPAINACLEQKMDASEATDSIFTAISKSNYVPASASERYRDAIHKEYQRRLSGDDISRDTLEIRVFGSGCVTCDKLAAQIFDILGKYNLVADIEKIFDMDEIWRHGVLTTPALMINGKILCQGKMPTPAEIEAWLDIAKDELNA
jgi:small redox-active disulfide protein 2